MLNKIRIDSKFSLKALKLKLKNELLIAHQVKGTIKYGPTKEEISNLKFKRSIYSSKTIKR